MPRCPDATWRGLSVSHGGPMSAELGCIVHVTTNHGDPFNYFNNPADKASSHFWIADDGTLEQYIDTATASWAQAGGNYQYVSVETSGTVDQPLNEAQLIAFAKVYAWGVRVHGWPLALAEHPGDRGLGWHGMGGAAWGGHLDCPGDLRKAQRAEVLRRAAPPTGVAPMFDPPLQVAGWCLVPGGAVAVAPDGSVYCEPGTLYRGGPNGKPYFVGRKAATIRPRPNTANTFQDPPYEIVATSGETYGAGGFG